MLFGSLMSYAVAQSQEDRDKYPKWAEACDRFGYEWEPHVAEPDDGWFVTVFRITKANGIDLKSSPKPPVLI